MKISPGDGNADVGEKSMPKDAQVMAAILRDMGIMEFEPRVINQFLEFSYRYITTILDDAKLLSNHAMKKAVDVDDVKLAVQLYTDENLTSPPTRDILLETARTRNSMQLPIPKPTCGLQLPPDRFCITATNYHPAKSAQKNKMAASTSFSNQTNPVPSNAPSVSTPVQATTFPKSESRPESSVEGKSGFNLATSSPFKQQGIKRKADAFDNGDYL